MITPTLCLVYLTSLLATQGEALPCVVGPPGERGLTGLTGRTGPPGPPGPGGVSFTRWGRTTCPGTRGMQLLYHGIVMGSAWNEAGSAEYLCMHRQPQHFRTTYGQQEARARLHGTEYEMLDTPPALSGIRGHDAPCSVCYTPTRSTKITIPGRTSCPPSWTREYYGYLMTDKYHPLHKSRVPVCIDVNAESLAGSAHLNTARSVLYFIEATCSGITCPPYFNGAELTCAVCTK